MLAAAAVAGAGAGDGFCSKLAAPLFRGLGNTRNEPANWATAVEVGTGIEGLCGLARKHKHNASLGTQMHSKQARNQLIASDCRLVCAESPIRLLSISYGQYLNAPGHVLGRICIAPGSLLWSRSFGRNQSMTMQ